MSSKTQKEITLLDGIPSPSVKAAVLNAVYDMSRIVVLDGYQFLAAKHPKLNKGIFVIDGNFGREHFKAALDEAKAAGLNTRKISVHGHTATYSGNIIDFSKFDEIGLSELLRRHSAADKLPVGYQASEDDVEAILRQNATAVGTSNGVPFDAMASEIFGTLDHQAIERQALYADDLQQQTVYANQEIVRQLCAKGILERERLAPGDCGEGATLVPLTAGAGPKSISDDDLCSQCQHRQGMNNEDGLSLCEKRWPGLQDPDGYVQQCPEFSAVTLHRVTLLVNVTSTEALYANALSRMISDHVDHDDANQLLTKNGVPDVGACLRIVFDPGKSPQGVEIMDSTCQLGA